jgi:GT2 family glycosyltransferase
MTHLPLVSIVTPSFNQAPFLEQTIVSVLEQDYPAVEYIIIDGGSTDGSIEVIRRYADRLAHWESGPDGGQADAINKGWSRCRGEVVAYLNSDDYYLPGAITRAVAAFEQHADIDIVCGQGQFVSHDGRYVQTSAFGVGDDGSWNLFDVGRFTSVPQPAAFLRKRVLDTVGFLDPSLHYTLDADLFLRAFAHFKGAALPATLAALRMHDTSKSVATGAKFAPEFVRIARRMIARPHNYPRYRIAPRRLMAGAHIVAARFCYVNGAFRPAIRHLATAARLSPDYRSLIASREVPRLLARRVLGKEAYYAASALGNRLARRR